MYLGFLYSDRPYFDDTRILCISEFMFRVQQKNRRIEAVSLLREKWVIPTQDRQRGKSFVQW